MNTYVYVYVSVNMSTNCIVINPKTTYLFQIFEQFTGCPIPLHGISHYGLSQGFGAAWFAYQEERYAQLYTHHHHEHILLEGAVSRDVGTKLVTESGEEHVLASG